MHGLIDTAIRALCRTASLGLFAEDDITEHRLPLPPVTGDFRFAAPPRSVARRQPPPAPSRAVLAVRRVRKARRAARKARRRGEARGKVSRRLRAARCAAAIFLSGTQPEDAMPVLDARRCLDVLLGIAPTPPPLEIPGYWMNENSGVLAPAVRAYLAGGLLSGEQIAALRAYLRQWIAAPGWRGLEVELLRNAIGGLITRAAIDDWIETAVDLGIDPL